MKQVGRNQEGRAGRYVIAANFVVIDNMPFQNPNRRVQPDRFREDLGRILQSRQVFEHRDTAAQNCCQFVTKLFLNAGKLSE